MPFHHFARSHAGGAQRGRARARAPALWDYTQFSPSDISYVRALTSSNEGWRERAASLASFSWRKRKLLMYLEESQVCGGPGRRPFPLDLNALDELRSIVKHVVHSPLLLLHPPGLSATPPPGKTVSRSCFPFVGASTPAVAALGERRLTD
jgi:hypothetical protein